MSQRAQHQTRILDFLLGKPSSAEYPEKMSEPRSEKERFSFRPLGIALAFGVLWGVLVSLRRYIIHPHCLSLPGSCSSASLPWIDRWVVKNNHDWGEVLSTNLQYVAVGFALLLPLIYHLVAWIRSRWLFKVGLRELGRDWISLLQAITITGACTEVARLTIQRPRPFVYRNVSYYGKDLQNYTSFFSGHTSFVAACATTAVLTLVARRVPRWLAISVSLLAGLMILATAVGRVEAGKHFVTDVIAGALAGIFVSMILVGIPIIFGRRTQSRGEDSPTQSQSHQPS